MPGAQARACHGELSGRLCSDPAERLQQSGHGLMPFASHLRRWPRVLHKSDWPGKLTVQVVGSDCLGFETLNDGDG